MSDDLKKLVADAEREARQDVTAGHCFLFFHKWTKWHSEDPWRQHRRCLRCGVSQTAEHENAPCRNHVWVTTEQHPLRKSEDSPASIGEIYRLRCVKCGEVSSRTMHN